MSEAFVAEIRIFAGNFAPRGWAFCDGQLLPIAQNTALFSLLGTIYGGDGKSNFRLPDLRGRAPMFYGQGAGLSQRFIGESWGTESETLQVSQMPAHGHAQVAALSADQAAPGADRVLGNAAMYAKPGALVPLAAGALASTGGGAPHNNLQPYLALSFIVALQGIFPPRS
jgi:microcystin-dependent protein